jgi:glycosyltransferase involved in cell wall biosynthesis
MMTSLIFEPGYEGHRTEYVLHLMRFIVKNPDLHGRFVFLLHENIKPSLDGFRDSDYFEIEYKNFTHVHKHSIARGSWEWNKVAEFLENRKNIRGIIFMEIDVYLLLFRSREFKRFNLEVRGILFQPYHHLKSNIKGIHSWITIVLKNYLIQKISLSFNKNIRKCFILNDKKGVDAMNKEIKDIFQFLPDPIQTDIPIVDVNTIKNIAGKYKISKDKKVLLLFGQIDNRKNLINIIDALRLFPIEIKNQICLIIAGKINDKVRDVYISYLDEFGKEVNATYNNQFVTDEEREVLFQSCDVVLMPYIDFYSSSGVLGHAISHGKRIIVSSLGILKDIVEEHDLGIAVNPEDIQSINAAIYKLLFGKECLKYDNQMFINEHNPDHFGKILLQA